MKRSWVGTGGAGVAIFAVVVAACGDARSPLPTAAEMAGAAAPAARTRSTQAVLTRVAPGPQPASPADFAGGLRRIAAPPFGDASIAVGPAGYVAVTSQMHGGKYFSGASTGLYHAPDGVSWQRIRIDGDESWLALADVAYGAGRFVAVGRRYGTEDGGNEVWTSTDGTTWERHRLPGDYVTQWTHVRFVAGRFFAWGSTTLGVSSDGTAWRSFEVPVASMVGVVNVDSLLVAAGIGLATSADAETWVPVAVDCETPGLCFSTPPPTESFPAPSMQFPYFERLTAGAGRVYAGPLESADGRSWSEALGPIPTDFVGGFFFSTSEAGSFMAWQPEGPPFAIDVVPSEPPPPPADGPNSFPDALDASFADGATCQDTRCLIIDGRLYAVQPAAGAAGGE